MAKAGAGAVSEAVSEAVAEAGAEDEAVSGQGLSAEDETTLYGPLPGDFWGDDSDRSPDLRQPAKQPDRQPDGQEDGQEDGRRAEGQQSDGRLPDQKRSAGQEAVAGEARTGGTAFAELQELFPGRILEIIKEPNVSEAQAEVDDAGPDALQGLGEDDSEGYDDPDQSRLSFGPDD